MVSNTMSKDLESRVSSIKERIKKVKEDNPDLYVGDFVMKQKQLTELNWDGDSDFRKSSDMEDLRRKLRPQMKG